MTNETQTIDVEANPLVKPSWMDDFPSELETDFRSEIGTKTVKLNNKSQEWILWAINNGLKQSIGDAIAGKAGTSEGQRLILAKYQRVCLDGQIPQGGSGGSSKLTAETAGWIAYFKSKGSPIKFKGETPNGKNLEKYQDAFTKKAIWPSIQKVLTTMTKPDQVDFHKTKLPGLIEKHKPAVIKAAEADQNGVGQFIEAEKMKRAGTKPETFHVDIQIEL